MLSDYYLRQGGNVFTSVCPFVCEQDYAKFSSVFETSSNYGFLLLWENLSLWGWSCINDRMAAFCCFHYILRSIREKSRFRSPMPRPYRVSMKTSGSKILGDCSPSEAFDVCQLVMTIAYFDQVEDCTTIHSFSNLLNLTLDCKVVVTVTMGNV